MGSNSNMNFGKSFGNEAAGDGSAGGSGRPPGSGLGSGNFGLARQLSIYSLTFDEFQNTLGGMGKDFGSMNMDELLKNIWSAEETQCGYLQRQGSLTLPRTLSQKTVDEVWKDIAKEFNGTKDGGGGSNVAQNQREQTLGEITLEEFLPAISYASAMTLPSNAQLGNTGLRGGIVGLADPGMNNNLVTGAAQQGGAGMGMVGLGGGGAIGVPAGSPAALSSDGLGRSNGDSSSVSPVPYMFNGGGLRGRKGIHAVDKVVERRQRRMIKNRESAARSRARKQAYTMELEQEVEKLKEENLELRKKQAEIMEQQKNQVMEMMNNAQTGSRKKLRRTQTGPW
uniref:BZIP domain-containing protein n=1 Tax=Chenopodium quinoa TaxID=63459 RepID=A0A803KQW6_CHEQI